MNPSINYQIKDRLEYKKEWLFYYKSILNQIEISEESYYEFYKSKIFTLIFIEVINFPTNLLKFIKKRHIIQKIKYLKNEISVLEKLIIKNNNFN